MINWIRHWKIRTRLLLLLVTLGIFCCFLFWVLWKNQENFCTLLEKAGVDAWDEKAFLEDLKETARTCTVPDSPPDWDETAPRYREALKKMEPVFALCDDYTSLGIYGISDGLFRCYWQPDYLRSRVTGFLFSTSHGYLLGEEANELAVTFQNGEFDVLYSSFHRTRFIYPYLAASLIFCILLYLGGVLLFVSRVLRRIRKVETEICHMATGDLSRSVPDCGGDEIGTLAFQLDGLRQALDSHIRREAENRKASQDLVTAMSHDLRTPLTILNGYLEVLRLHREDPARQEEYLNRCLEKTRDIRELTDRMFEYALVYDAAEPISLHPVPLPFLEQCLRENADYVRLAGFTTELDIHCPQGQLLADEVSLKRVFSNLFSNILKYGDKHTPVTASLGVHRQQVKLCLRNAVRPDISLTESNRIGLKSTEKIIELLGGELYVIEDEFFFLAEITLPLCDQKAFTLPPCG